MNSELSRQQQLGHMRGHALRREAWGFRLGLALCLLAICVAVKTGADHDLLALCFSSLLFIRKVFEQSAQIAEKIDHMANF